MIGDSIAYLREQGKRPYYDAEHFFDAWADDSGYALECLRSAVSAGAENVTLCDTNGATLPAEVAEATGQSSRLLVPTSRSASTPTTTPSAPLHRLRRSTPARHSCRARSTAVASGPATQT